MTTHTTHSRDAALGRVRRLNRWLIAGSVVLTGVLTDAAANAFSGHRIKSTTRDARPGGRSTTTHKPAEPLKVPSQAPAQSSSGAAGSGESAQAPSTGSESSSSTQTEAPAQESSTQSESPANGGESSARPEEAVTSGGS